MLCTSRLNQNLSAHAFIFGQFDFQSTPLAPPGTKVFSHTKPYVRKSWDTNGEVGWYVNAAPNHYRCVTCYFPRTRQERITDTVTFIPHAIAFPSVNVIDFLRQTATDIVSILKAPPNNIIPNLEAGDQTYNALLEIASVLNKTE